MLYVKKRWISTSIIKLIIFRILSIETNWSRPCDSLLGNGDNAYGYSHLYMYIHLYYICSTLISSYKTSMDFAQYSNTGYIIFILLALIYFTLKNDDKIYTIQYYSILTISMAKAVFYVQMYKCSENICICRTK